MGRGYQVRPDPITVKVKHPENEHTVRVQDFEGWPAEMILKNRLRELLAKGK
jgi:hypothetical protein